MEAGMGIGGLALIDLLNQDNLLGGRVRRRAPASTTSIPRYAPKPPHFKPRAKSVISLFMSGGVSHIDTFQYKPALEKYNRMPMEGHGDIKVRQGYPGPLMKSPFTFQAIRAVGRLGVGDLPEHRHDRRRPGLHALLPRYSRTTTSFRTTSGTPAPFRWVIPSVGAWVTYGLGSENQNLPGFVVLAGPKEAVRMRSARTGRTGSCRRRIRGRCSVPRAIRFWILSAARPIHDSGTGASAPRPDWNCSIRISRNSIPGSCESLGPHLFL